MAKRGTELQQEKPMKDLEPIKTAEASNLTSNISVSSVLEYIVEQAVNGGFQGHVAEIATALNRSKRSIQRITRILRTAGVIEADCMIVSGKLRNVYHLNWSVEKIQAEIEMAKHGSVESALLKGIQRAKPLNLNNETTRRVLAHMAEKSVDGVFIGRMSEIEASLDRSVSSISNAVSRLRKAGVIEVERARDGTRWRHIYHLNWSIDKIRAETELVKPELVKPELPRPEPVTLVHLERIRRENMPISDESAQVLAYMAENATSDRRFLLRVPDVATALRLSKNRVAIAFRDLKGIGAIETERWGEGTNWRNVYMVRWPERVARKIGSAPECKLIGRTINETDTPEKILQSALDFLGAPLKPEHSAAVFALMRQAPKRQPGLRGLEFSSGAF